MLKKITIISAAVLAAATIVGIALLPGAVRDVLDNSDRIVSQFIRSTPVANFDGNQYASVYVDMAYSSLLVEQSPDENIYVKVEGLFIDRYRIAHEEHLEEDGNRLDLRLDYSDSFFNENSSYLFWRAINDSGTHVVILRVPPTVSVGTSRPWQVSVDEGVRFTNANYYRTEGWRGGAGNYDPGTVRGKLQERYDTLFAGFETDLEMALATGYAQEEPDVAKITGEIDEAVRVHYGRMNGELFPYESDVYSEETLSSMLRSAMMLRGKLYQEKARYELGYSGDAAEHRFDALQESANRAMDTFERTYRKYIEEAPPEALEEQPKETPPGSTIELTPDGGAQ